MRTDRILEIRQLLLSASYEKMSSADRREMIKLRKRLRPIAEEAEADQKEADETLKPQIYKDLQEGKASIADMTDNERAKADAEIAAYYRELSEAMKPTMEKEHEIEFPKLTSDAFDRWLEVNPKWNGAQTDALIEAFGVEY